MRRDECVRAQMFAVVKTVGGYGVKDYTSITDEPPSDAVHTYIERPKAVAKAAELNKK